MRLGIGLGLFKAGLISAGVRIFSAFQTRVIGDGGTIESGTCVVNGINGSALLQSASLLLIPSGYKGGKLYAEIPTNGNGDLTWTRGGDAFRTNASGVLQRVPWNLLSWSEDLTNASWSKTNATITGDNTLAPNGTLTADLVSFSTSSGYVLKTQSVAPATQYTFSAYFKNNTFASGETILFRLSDGVIAPAIATINLVAKTATYNTNPSAWTNLSGTIEQLPNDWFRISVTATSVNGGNGWIEVVTNGFTKSCFVWGVQLVTSSTAQTYLPTTDRLNFPRLSYMYGSCPSALLEPQRTNLLTYSQAFNDATWAKVASIGGSITATDNYNSSPDGNTNASRLLITNLNSAYVAKSFTSVNGSSYTISIWAKSNTASSYTFQLRDGYSGVVSSNLTVTPTWQRFTLTFTASGTTAELQFRTLVVGSYDLSIYGAQAELGAYPTTYIPTTSATATRVADSFSRSNIYTNGLISASGGTWFVELRGNLSYTRDALSTGLFIDTDTNSYTNGINIRNAGGGSTRLVISKWILGMGLPLFTTKTDTVKIAIKWNGTTADIFANGTKVVSATSFTPTAMQFLKSIDNQVPMFIQQMALFPTPLSDTDCATLTT